MDAEGLRTLTELSASQAREATALAVDALRLDGLTAVSREAARR